MAALVYDATNKLILKSLNGENPEVVDIAGDNSMMLVFGTYLVLLGIGYTMNIKYYSDEYILIKVSQGQESMIYGFTGNEAKYLSLAEHIHSYAPDKSFPLPIGNGKYFYVWKF